MSTVALEMYRSLPRTVAGKALSGRVSTTSFAPLRLVTRDERGTQRNDWARLRTRLSGICGSDLGALSGKTSLYFSALVSMPFVPGHEVVAELIDDCGDLPAGNRVVVDPVLACAARGVESCVACEQGRTNHCERITVGHLKPGLQTGFCADTGGGWSQRFEAHRSQLHVVPDDLPDTQAVLIEPTACAVHTALRARIQPQDRVLISGAGAVGLLTTLALRSLTQAGEITVVAKHAHQRELALLCGASEVVKPSETLRRIRRATTAFEVSPQYGSPYLLGGVDVAIDAVGSRASVQTALHATRAGGRVVLAGMPATADFSHAWFRELSVVGAYASARREDGLDGRGAFDVATELARGEAVTALAQKVASYPLQRWREALDHAGGAGGLGTVKVVFDPRSTR